MKATQERINTVISQNCAEFTNFNMVVAFVQERFNMNQFDATNVVKAYVETMPRGVLPKAELQKGV